MPHFLISVIYNPLNIILQATDLNNDTLTYSIVDNPTHGGLSDVNINSVTYTPNTGFLGTDTFTFKAYDGKAYSNVANVSIDIYEPYQWSTPERIDTGSIGTQPTISYSPAGDLRIFYNIDPPNEMVVRKRLNGQSVFGSEISVYPDARTAVVHYDSANPNTIDLAVETGSKAIILQSTDNGNSWNFIKDYWATISCSATQPLGFTEDSNNLRLFYGYMGYSAVFGCQNKINYAQRINDVWDTTGVTLGDGVVSGTYENGDSVLCFNSGRTIYKSVDNGLSFNTFNVGRTNGYTTDVVSGSDGRLYVLQEYTYGVGPNNHHLVYYYSDDQGATWSTEQPVVMNTKYYFFSTHFAVSGNKMVAIWVDAEPPDYTNRFLRCVVSEDKGVTWSPTQTIVSFESLSRLQVILAITLDTYV